MNMHIYIYVDSNQVGHTSDSQSKTSAIDIKYGMVIKNLMFVRVLTFLAISNRTCSHKNHSPKMDSGIYPTFPRELQVWGPLSTSEVSRILGQKHVTLMVKCFMKFKHRTDFCYFQSSWRWPVRGSLHI